MVVDGRRYGWVEKTRVMRRPYRPAPVTWHWFVVYWCGIVLIGAALTGLGLKAMGAGW